MYTNYKFIIYGFSEKAELVYQVLSREECDVLFFFDRNAKENDTFNNVPICKMEDSGLSEKEKKNIVVVLCFHDAFQHDIVAQRLVDNGFLKILYAPINYYIDERDKKTLRELYNQVIMGETIEWGKVPIRKSYFKKKKYIAKVIGEYTNNIVFLCPYNMVFTSLDIEQEVIESIHNYSGSITNFVG